MRYNVEGDNLPVLKVYLEAGEQIQCEAGAMSWMDEGIEMQTSAGGLGKMLGRMFTNENAFMNTYIASQTGEIAFSSKFPGSIRAVEITPGNGLIVQKGSYLASVGNLTNEVYLQKRFSTGFFGGEGFIMQKYSGSGYAWLEIDGSVQERVLADGEQLIIDSGYVAAMEDTCSMDIQTVKGLANVVLGGEGLFNTVVTGPGKVWLQTMPINALAMNLYAYMPHPSN